MLIKVIGVQRQRQQHIGLLHRSHRRHHFVAEREVRRHDADDRVVLAIERQRLAKHIPITAEALLPETIAEDDRRRLAASVFFRQEDASQLRLRAEDREHI